MAVGLALVWVGYTLSYFGVCSIRGPGVGLLDLVIPGRKVVIPAGGSGASTGSGFPAGTTISGADANGTSIVTPGDGGRPYRLVPVGGGNYSQEPIYGPDNPEPGTTTT